MKQIRRILFLIVISCSIQIFAAAGKHEPIMTADDLMYLLHEDRTLELEFDRPTKVYLRPWHTDIPGIPNEFQISATLPSGKKLKSQMSKNPMVEIAETGKVQFEFAGDGPAIHFVLFTEKAPRENEVGACGFTPRDLFLKWFKKEWQWEELELINHFREDNPKTFTFSFGAGTSPDRKEYIIEGSLKTQTGTILQITMNEFNYSDRYPYRSVLFFNKSGDLTVKIPGLIYKQDADGNLYVSLTAKDKNTPFPKPEEIAKVTPEGKILWQTPVYGVEPFALLQETLSGNRVIPWNAPSHLGSHPINSPVIDPKTGKQTWQDSIIDWTDICSDKNMTGDCQKAETEAKANLRQFWLTYMKEHKYQENEHGQACLPEEYFCYNLHLVGYKKLKDRMLLQVSITHSRDSGNGVENYALLFNANQTTRISGVYYRHIGEDLMISTALDSHFGSGTPWYDTSEKLALFDSNGTKKWERELTAGPMYIKNLFQNQFSNGVLLKDDQLLWMGAPRNAYSVSKTWIDLKTGTPLPEQRPAIGEGLCK